jgi:signal transduction histidine kinase
VRGIHYLDSVTGDYHKLDAVNRFEYFLIHYNLNYKQKNDYAAAMVNADSMLAIVQNTRDKKKLAKQLGIAYFAKGDVYFNTGRYAEAYQYYFNGEQTGKNYVDNCTIADYSYHMGMIMYKQEHYQLAAQHFINSFDQSKSCLDNFVYYYRRQELLDNAGISYYKANMPEHAQIYYEKALEYITTNGVKYPDQAGRIEMAKGVVYGNLAKIYMDKKDIAKAGYLLKQSIAINLKKGNDNRDAQLTELKLAHLYSDNKKIELLVPLLKDIRRQLDTLKNNVAEIDWNHLMANYYQHNNDLKKAIYYFNRYDAIKDSVTKAEQKLKELDVNQEFKNLESESTINLLKNDNQVQQRYLIASLIYAVMALIIILLVFMNWRRSKNNVMVLSELNHKITEQKHQLETSLTDLEDNSREKDRILRAVSHDLRNPIGGIASLTAMMLMEPGLDAEQLELLQLIQSTTNNSLELINEILEATGVLSSKTVTKQYVDINVLLSHSVELLRFKAAEKNQKIMLDVLESPEELYISREKIWRVLSNLISNAIKFSPQGSVITVKVATPDKDSVQISVNDHGIGIPDEIKDQVFHMFTEAKRPGTEGEKSFGLGLSICKQIIESHNGEIWFEGMPDGGTTFFIRLKKQMA